MRKSLTKLTGILLLLILTGVATAQNIADQCQALVEDAFSDLGINCASQTPNSICYGYGDVEGMFAQGTEVMTRDDFSEPGDIVDLTSTTPSAQALDTFSGQALDVQNNEWGVAVVNTQANMPAAYDSRGAVIFAFGNAEVKNEVPAAQAFVSTTTLDVTLDGATLFTAPPGYDEPQLAIEAITDTLIADAISPDGEWVRVYYEYERQLGATRVDAWVAIEDISASGDVDTLPVYGPDSRAPMQSFSITQSGTVPEGCEDVVPSGLLIQGPGDVETDLYINGLHVRVSSTIFVFLEPDGSLIFATLSGILIIEPNTPDEQIVPVGYTVSVLTPGPGCFVDGVLDLSAEDCEFSYTPIAIIPAGIVDLFIAILANLPDNILNYLPVVIIVVDPSAVGGSEPSVEPGQSDAERIEALCDLGILPEEVCAVYP